jgi:hypothetical protein
VIELKKAEGSQNCHKNKYQGGNQNTLSSNIEIVGCGVGKYKVGGGGCFGS